MFQSTSSQVEIDVLLDAHNGYRRKVAKGEESGTKTGSALPVAANMRKLTWNEELATTAQTYNCEQKNSMPPN